MIKCSRPNLPKSQSYPDISKLRTQFKHSFSFRCMRNVSRIILLTLLFSLCSILSFALFYTDGHPRTSSKPLSENRDFLRHKKSAEAISEPVASTVLETPLKYHYKYIILETDTCQTFTHSDIFVLTIIHTHPAHYKKRNLIRETWGGSRKYFRPEVKFAVLFTMGSVSNNPELMKAVLAESARYRDIIQQDFEDSYRNLTLKAIMWLKWSNDYCRQADFVLKVDDDIFVNTFSLVNHLLHLLKRQVVHERTLLCLVWYNTSVIRDKSSKWYLSEEDYPNDFFTVYCSGSSYILTGDLTGPMYEKALVTKFFWVDDFFITGLVPQAVGNVTYYSIGGLYSLLENEVFDRLANTGAVFGHVPGSLMLRYKLWREILKWRGINERPVEEAVIIEEINTDADMNTITV